MVPVTVKSSQLVKTRDPAAIVIVCVKFQNTFEYLNVHSSSTFTVYFRK